jgi:hypothetical protein
MTDDDRKQLTRYLLGDNLTIEEQTAIEARYFQDDEFFDAMESVEDQLIDLYLSGRLPDNQKEPFEKNYLAVHWRRRRVALIQELNTAFRENVRTGTALSGLLGEQLRNRLGWVAGRAEEWFARVGIPSLRLSPVERSGQAANVLTIAATARIARILIPTRMDANHDAWRAIIQNPKLEVVWSQQDVPVHVDEETATAEVFIPTECLEIGEYFLILQGKAGSSDFSTIATYQFAVEAHRLRS